MPSPEEMQFLIYGSKYVKKVIIISLNAGDIVEVKLDNLAYGGECVGHIEGLALFVAGGIPGEEVAVRITEVKNNYARGQITEIIEPSSARRQPPCSVYEE